MKKTIAKTAAIIMAAMMTGTVCMPLTVSATNSSASDTAKADEAKKEANMKAALTVAKKRVTVPPELTEFGYSTDTSYGVTVYSFGWHTPEGAEEYKDMSVIVMGDTIISYDSSKDKSYSYEPRLAKLTEAQLLEKAKGYAKQLNPDIYNKLVFEIQSLSLTDNTAQVYFTRYENGAPVPSNKGSMELDKNTGELYGFSLNWWNNASFSDPKTAKSEREIKEAYKSLCKLTPYYMISSEYDEKTKKSKNVARIVYDPDMNDEIDAYTGKASSIWEDMKKAEGTRFYKYYDIANAATGIAEESADAGVEGDDDAVEFSPAELEKIEKDNNLIKTAELFDKFKKDPYVALNDNYKLDRHNIYSEKDENGKETFYMELTYEFDKTKKADNYYKTINVRINGETGEVLHLNKWGLVSSDGLPKLDVTKANTVANNVAKTYSKDIFSQYKASPDNTKPVEVWQTKIKNQTVTEYETSRSFAFDRYVNGIRVNGDNIRADVDSLGTVRYYSVSHTDNVSFPSADIMTADEAFEKLYTQRKFDYYYDGWLDKEGKLHTYLLYKMESFYLNAKTGDICTWNGTEPYSYSDPRDVKYTDIKGIPQEEAILTLQKYGIVVTKDKKFDPTAIITEDEFSALLYGALYSEEPVAYDEVEPDEMSPEEKAQLEAEKKDKAETTREEAAVIFAGSCGANNIAELKGIFKTPFSDVKDSNENIGYIAIAYAKGFIPKTADGKFNGGHKITRAEAAQMVYDYLKLLSK